MPGVRTLQRTAIQPRNLPQVEGESEGRSLSRAVAATCPECVVGPEPTDRTTKAGERLPPLLWQSKAGFTKPTEGVRQENDEMSEANIRLDNNKAESYINDIPHSQVNPPPVEVDSSAAEEDKASVQDSTDDVSTEQDEDPQEQATEESSAVDTDSRKGSTGTQRSRRRRNPVQRLVAAHAVAIAVTTCEGVPGEIFSIAAMFPNSRDAHPMAEMYACAATTPNNPDNEATGQRQVPGGHEQIY